MGVFDVSRRMPLFVLATVLAWIVVGVTPAVGHAEGSKAVAWGADGNGNIGVGWKTKWELTPEPVAANPSFENLTTIVEMAGAYNVSLVRLANGEVRTWGGNDAFQLGVGIHENTSVPVNPGLTEVKQIAYGGAHAIVLLQNGKVMIWGSDQQGEAGNGILNPCIDGSGEREIYGGCTGCVEPEHTCTMQGSNKWQPIEVTIPSESKVVAVATGPASGSDYALLENGHVYAWGENNGGQLGTGEIGPETCKTEVGAVKCSTKPKPVMAKAGEELSGVEAIAVGEYSAYALVEHKVLAFGKNAKGQLGNNTTTDSSYPVQVKRLVGSELKTLEHVKQLSAGATHVLALLEGEEAGKAVAWGANVDGELALSPEIGTGKPEECINSKNPCSKVAKEVPGLEKLTQVSGGVQYSLVLNESGQVYAFGANDNGKLGIGSTTGTATPTLVEGLAPVAKIAAGEQHSLALLREGEAQPEPIVSIKPGSKSLEAKWKITATKVKVEIRPVGGEWAGLTSVEGVQHYTFTEYRGSALSVGTTYEIGIGEAEQQRRIVGIPLP